MELTEEELKGKILEKLVRFRKFMASYTQKRDAVKGMPPHFTGLALQLIEEMVKDNILLEYKNRECVSINLEKMEEVNRLRGLFLKKKFN